MERNYEYYYESVERVCRICQSTQERANLIRPCDCNGSMAYVHAVCLQNWISASSRLACEVCTRQYRGRKICKYGALASIFPYLKARWYRPKLNFVVLFAYLLAEQTVLGVKEYYRRRRGGSNIGRIYRGGGDDDDTTTPTKFRDTRKYCNYFRHVVASDDTRCGRRRRRRIRPFDDIFATLADRRLLTSLAVRWFDYVLSPRSFFLLAMAFRDWSAWRRTQIVFIVDSS